MLGIWVAGCFLLGYRLPWFDKHPDWPEFPQVTNPRFVIEQIPDSTFDKQYGQRFRLPTDFRDETKDYAATIRAVRYLGHQVLSNEYRGLSLNITGGNSTGWVDHYPTPRMRFSQRGYDYYELTLGQEKAYFKDHYYSPFPPFLLFYQYNYPATGQDTLFLYANADNYRIYLRKAAQTR